MKLCTWFWDYIFAPTIEHIILWSFPDQAGFILSRKVKTNISTACYIVLIIAVGVLGIFYIKDSEMYTKFPKHIIIIREWCQCTILFHIVICSLFFWYPAIIDSSDLSALCWPYYFASLHSSAMPAPKKKKKKALS